MKSGTAIIIGAGPAGLTAAIELQRRTGIKPIVIEASRAIGGLSRTVCYKGNRMDIGGHRFFSKSDRVMLWWLDIMPLEAGSRENGRLRYQGRQRELPSMTSSADPRTEDLVMLVRPRKSRIYLLRHFFDYPIRLTSDTLKKMGLARTLRCGFSYLYSSLLPQRKEHTLEDFLINRFGKQLYLMFYKSYTEKVWGVPCHEISAEWGAQRIKGLSLRSVVTHYLRETFRPMHSGDIAQKSTETSLIEQFLYPKFGPGQFWEHVAGLVRRAGGELHLGITIDRVHLEAGKVVSIEGVTEAGERICYPGDYFFSSMPVRDLIRAVGSEVPKEVAEVAGGLLYRDFMLVGLLAKKLAVAEEDGSPLKDNWIYIQDPSVMAGRLQIFNNWSPWLVSKPDGVWIGLEYFCNETDPLWKLSDEAMTKLAVQEATAIGILKPEDVEDSHVVHVSKAYPGYFGSYNNFDVIRNYTDGLANLFLVGRNGMHKYNNQDHSMLTAMEAVENIVDGVETKDNIWAINADMEYQEDELRK